MEHDRITSPLVEPSMLRLESPKREKKYYSGFISIPLLLPIVVILNLSDDDCDKPIRLWLYVLGITYSLAILISLFEFFTGILSKSPKAGRFIITLFILLHLAWCTTGNVWLFSDDQCSDSWNEGYVLSLVILICFYVFTALLVLFLCCFLWLSYSFASVLKGWAEGRKDN